MNENEADSCKHEPLKEYDYESFRLMKLHGKRTVDCDDCDTTYFIRYNPLIDEFHLRRNP